MQLIRRLFRHGEPALPLRHDTRDALRNANADDPDAEWIDDALIVISELVQNVTQHTDSHGELTVTLRSDTVLIEVGDTSTVTPQPRNPGPDRIGGRGLLLIAAVSQQWGVRSCPNGKIVWVELRAVIDAKRPSTVQKQSSRL